MKTRIGIYGYGNLARGVEKAVLASPDMELFGIFTRRDPKSIASQFGTKVYSNDDAEKFADKIDVMINCGGSAKDLPVSTPTLAKYFNVVDSFDTHTDIPKHFKKIDEIAKENNKTAIISSGWDPGLFSIMRILFDSALPDGESYSFWGKGISQGHSDAIRRIDGVLDARQYTIPIEESVNRVRNGENPELSARQKHLRECYVVPKEGADLAKIESEIRTMPCYFADYDTIIHFITLDELKKNHSALPHAGNVIRSGKTDEDTKHLLEFSLKLDSNPEFTGSVICAVARACAVFAANKDFGCKTMLDIPPKALSPKSYDEILEHIL